MPDQLADMTAVPSDELAGDHVALDRTSFAYLIANTSLCHVDCIRAAVERADHDDAAMRALARTKLGLTLPSELAADILIGVERVDVFVALARQQRSEALQPLLDLLHRGRFVDDSIGIDQTVYTAFTLWQMQAPHVVLPVVLPWLRRLARQPQLPVRAVGLIGWLARQIGNPHLQEIYDKQHGGLGDELVQAVGRFMLDLWTATIDEVVALLPERAPNLLLASIPVRAGPKVKRNNSCPCGSGKKYKRCCAGNVATAPMNAGPSRAECLRALEPRLEREQIARLSRVDLAQLDLTRLRESAVIDVMRRQWLLRDWRRACMAIDEITRRRGKKIAASHLQEVIYAAINVRQYDVAHQLLAELDDTDSAADLRLEVALAAPGSETLAQLEAASRATLSDEGALSAIDLAHATLRTIPALGILIARGALVTGALFEGEVLLDEIEEARDYLELPPDDPAQESFDALGGVRKAKVEAVVADEERARLVRTAAQLRASLEDATGRLLALQRQVADRARELEYAERASAEPTQRAAESPAAQRERGALRNKIDELQALIRERNEERARLRRQLADATSSNADVQAVPSIPGRGGASDDADEGLEELPAHAAVRPVLLPRFEPAAGAAFETIPRKVASIAMRTLGALAAGDSAAWRAVKQATDMPRQVLMARVGIHHRVLFRADGDALDVLDVVTRESLLTTLKRLRST